MASEVDYQMWNAGGRFLIQQKRPVQPREYPDSWVGDRGWRFYYVRVMQAQKEVEPEPSGTSTQVQINANRIPPGAPMEDGTLPE